MSKIIVTDKQAEAVIRGYARLTKTSHIAPRRLLRMKQALQDAFNAREVIKTKSTQDLEDMWVGQIASTCFAKSIGGVEDDAAKWVYDFVDALLAEREKRLKCK